MKIFFKEYSNKKLSQSGDNAKIKAHNIGNKTSQLRSFARDLFCIIFLLITVTALSSCAYRWGSPDRSLPGGYKQIFIPIFKNYTQEVQVEVAFANSLRQEFERSKIARITDKSEADVELIGEIESLQYLPSAPKEGGTLPTGTVLATQYRILMGVKLTLKKIADNTVLWTGNFSGERTYVAPQLTQAGINTVNPLYNLSSRRQNIEVIASTLMAEAHDRITENF